MLFRYVAITFLSAAVSLPAMAQNRPDTRAMSCDEVRATIAARGAVVMTTGRHTFDRYVTDTRHCAPPEIALVTTVPTRDVAQCMVYACRANPHDD